MKKLVLLPLLAVIAMSATFLASYTVNTTDSKIVWTGYKVTGQHTGNVNVKSGSVEYADGKLTGGSFTVDMASITCTDLQGEWGDKLVGHIKSADFFGVETHPTATYTITKAIATDTKGNYKIVGNLQIKEKTKEVKFNANVVEANGAITATGKMTIDRSDFDVKYGSGSFFDGLGDKTIYDDFDLQITLSAKK